MKRIGIDCTDAQHAQIKRLAAKQNQTIVNYIRAFLGWPLLQQGERKDLNGRRKKSATFVK
jgi:hypothetical protein